MEHICEKCKNQDAENYDQDEKYICKFGYVTYYECQVACTDDYFEKKG